MLAEWGEGGGGCRVSGQPGGNRQLEGGSLAHQGDRQGGRGSCKEDSVSQTNGEVRLGHGERVAQTAMEGEVEQVLAMVRVGAAHLWT